MNKSISPSSNKGNQRFRELVNSNPALLGEVADAKIFNDIAQQLYLLRRQSGLTQKDLAEKIDLKQSHISRWEKPGYQGYKIKVLSKLARTLNGRLEVRLMPPLSNYTVAYSYTEIEDNFNQIIHPDGTKITSSKSTSKSLTISMPILEGAI